MRLLLDAEPAKAAPNNVKVTNKRKKKGRVIIGKEQMRLPLESPNFLVSLSKANAATTASDREQQMTTMSASIDKDLPWSNHAITEIRKNMLNESVTSSVAPSTLSPR